jgi:hypothetical protein
VRGPAGEGFLEARLFADLSRQFEGGEVDLPELEVVLELDVGLAVPALQLLPHLPQLPAALALAPAQRSRVLAQHQLSRTPFHPKKLEILSTKYSHL